MQTFKIKNYEREHGPGTFVSFRHLANSETNSIKESLRMRLKLPQGVLSQQILQAIQARSTPIKGVSAAEDNFDLRHLLGHLGFNLSEVTYLNWHHFDDVDEIGTGDMLTNFSDIWYPSADDLELIDSKMQWVLSLHHCGTVKALSLGKN